MVYKRTILAVISVAVLYLMSCSSQQESSGLQEITIAINVDKTILINDEVIPVDRLVEKLQALEVREGTQVNMKIAGDVEMGFVNEIQRILRSADLTKISYAGKSA
ncbi:MAG: ExbD/TolR family protein [bacterium]